MYTDIIPFSKLNVRLLNRRFKIIKFDIRQRLKYAHGWIRFAAFWFLQYTYQIQFSDTIYCIYCRGSGHIFYLQPPLFSLCIPPCHGIKIKSRDIAYLCRNTFKFTNHSIHQTCLAQTLPLYKSSFARNNFRNILFFPFGTCSDLLHFQLLFIFIIKNWDNFFATTF